MGRMWCCFLHAQPRQMPLIPAGVTRQQVDAHRSGLRHRAQPFSSRRCESGHGNQEIFQHSPVRGTGRSRGTRSDGPVIAGLLGLGVRGSDCVPPFRPLKPSTYLLSQNLPTSFGQACHKVPDVAIMWPAP